MIFLALPELPLQLEGPNDYPWTWDSWSETLSLFPKLRTLWLRTPLALTEDLGSALTIALDDDDSLSIPDIDLNKFLEDLVGLTWTTRSPSIQRVYLFFGYDDNLNIGDGMCTAGCQFRMSKLDSGDWKAVNIAYWTGRNQGFFSHLYYSFDSLPGVLDVDVDPFEEP